MLTENVPSKSMNLLQLAGFGVDGNVYFYYMSLILNVGI